MQSVLDQIAALKHEFTELRPGRTEALPPDLQRVYDIELTYASNAIEGNTLTPGETADVIEHGITVGGKSLGDHLEAVDHYDAVQWMRAVALRPEPLDEEVITELHRRIVARSRPEIAGLYSRHARRIVGSPMVFPNAAKLPMLMERLGDELARADDQPATAFAMHYRLVAIHPFEDGNGRTARLLMNLLLVRGGYVPVPVGPEDREEYLETLMAADSTGEDTVPAFQPFMHRLLAMALERHVDDLRQSLPAAGNPTAEVGLERAEPPPDPDLD